MKRFLILLGALILVAALVVLILTSAPAGETDEIVPGDSGKVVYGDFGVHKMSPEETEQFNQRIKAQVAYSREHSLPRLLENLKANEVKVDPAEMEWLVIWLP